MTAKIQTFPRFGQMLAAERAIKGLLAGRGLEELERQQLRRLWQLPGPERWQELSRFNEAEWQDDRLTRVLMATATANFPNMGALVANTGGGVETLGGVNTTGGRQRTWIDTLTLASQASGQIFGVARLPLFSALLCIEVLTSVSLGSATIQFGDANNSTLFAAAQTLTAVNTVTRFATSATKGQPITSGYDSVTGNLVSATMPQTPGEGGLNYEDVLMTTAAAALPASGSLVVMVEYLGPDS